MNLLSEDDLIELTKAKQPNKQADVLSDNGIYFIKRLDGSIVTTWHHVNHPSTHAAINDSAPNFGAIGNG